MSDLVRDPMYEIAQELISSIAAIIRTGDVSERMGDRRTFEAFRELVLRALKISPRFELRFLYDGATVNDLALPLDAFLVERVERVASAMHMRGFGGIGFDRAPAVEAFERYFAKCLGAPATTEDDRQALRPLLSEFARLGIRTLGQLRSSDKSEQAEAEAARSPKHRAFFVSAWTRTATLSQAIADGLRAGARIPPPETWRVALDDLTTATLERPNYAMRIIGAEHAQRTGLATKGIGPRASHSASTSVLAIAIGASIGLERAALADLASCAFFADLGYALLPPALLDRDIELSEEERAELRGAAMRAFASVLGKSQLSDIFLLRLLVVLEQSHEPRHAHLFSRIVAVASAYDAMTRPQPWRPARRVRDALELFAKEEQRFDKRIVRALESLLETLASGVRC